MHLFFDFDGTLADTSKGIVNGYDYAFSKFGGKNVSHETIEKNIGPPLIEAIRHMAPDLDEKEAEQVGKLYREYYSETGLYELEFYEGITGMLEDVGAKAEGMHILTSKPTVFVQRILSKYGISCFTDVIGLSLEFSNKSKPERFRDYLSANGIEPKDSVVIGDRHEDFRAAREAGAAFVGALYGYGARDEYPDQSVCDTPLDVRNVLLSLMSGYSDEFSGRLNNLYNTDGLKRFIFPSKVFYGPESESYLEEIMPAEGAVVVADCFLKDNALFQKLQEGKHFSNIFYVYNEPRYSDVDGFLQEIKGLPTAIIAIGGGSSLDIAKAIKSQFIYGTYKGIGYGPFRTIHSCMDPKGIPLIAVPTMPSSGAEMSRYFLIVNDATHEKTVCRSWNIIPNTCVMVTGFLKDLPMGLLVPSVFDAFLHLFETYTCAHESSYTTGMMAVQGISTILMTMDEIDRTHPDKLSLEALQDLQLSAMLGGASLSNTRSGIIHNAGEYLSSFVRISHPMSLIVFYESVLRYYEPEIKAKMAPMLALVNSQVKGIVGLEDIIKLWNSLFEYYGVTERIRTILAPAALDADKITDHVFADKVWVDKESPRLFGRDDVYDVVKKSLAQFGK